MKQTCDTNQKGFTFIELLIVFTLMAGLAITGIASLNKFNSAQVTNNTALDLKSMLTQAKYNALNEVVGSNCPVNQQLDGYKVLICCSGSGCPTCVSPNNYSYELDAVCGTSSVPNPVSGKNLPNGVSIGSGTTSRSYFFSAVSNSVTGAGQVVLTGYGNTNTVTVSSVGVIQ